MYVKDSFGEFGGNKKLFYNVMIRIPEVVQQYVNAEDKQLKPYSNKYIIYSMLLLHYLDCIEGVKLIIE